MPYLQHVELLVRGFGTRKLSKADIALHINPISLFCICLISFEVFICALHLVQQINTWVFSKDMDSVRSLSYPNSDDALD